MPLPIADLDAMFEHLGVEVSEDGCDGSLRLAEMWLAERGHDAVPVREWLEEHGGFCDCEVIYNVRTVLDRAKSVMPRKVSA
ncbi:MAG: DUF2695 domain-containing protein [Kofleriaceae bacterium]